MKYFFVLGLLLSGMSSYSQMAVDISPPISVTNNAASFGKHLPKIELFGDGTPVVFWSKAGATSHLYLAIMDDTSFSEPIQVPTGTVNPNVWGGALGPDFAVRDNVIFIVFEKYGDAIYCQKSTDRGQTFSDAVVVYDPPSGKYATLPTVYISEEYNPIVGFITTNASEEEAESVLVTSSDGGETFGTAVVANANADGTEVCECCPSGLLIDNEGDYYFSFRNNNENIRDIWVAKSTDNGQSFPDAVDVDETNWFIQGCPSTGPQSFDMGSELLTVFFSAADGWETGVYMNTFDKTTLISDAVLKLPTLDGLPNNQYFPRIDGNGDTLGIVWHESVAGNTEIILAYSTSGVTGLLENTVNVSDMINSQTFSDIVYKNGEFHIVYEDQSSGTIMYQVATLQEAVDVPESNNPAVDLNVYPNPAHNMVTITMNDNNSQTSKLIVRDITGRIYYQNDQFHNKANINVDSWECGVYLITLESNHRQYLTKLIVR